jgi:hypothetical protein
MSPECHNFWQVLAGPAHLRLLGDHLRMVADIWSMKLFVRLLGRHGELLDSHLFFYVRYCQLAEIHERHGRFARAARLDAIAEHYFQLAPDGDDDDPRKAAAMAMPVLRRRIFTNAVSKPRGPTPPSPGTSSIAPIPAS